MGWCELTLEEKYAFIKLSNQRELNKKRNLAKNYFIDCPVEESEFSRYLYPKWIEFFTAGKKYTERLALCANQVGKTTAELFEITLHLTGLYDEIWGPDWPGFRFETANDWWISGVDQKSVRSVLQDRLLGPVGEFGTGMIPFECLDFGSLKDAVKSDTSISTVRVKHKNGGYSVLEFKSDAQGRRAYQGKPGISIWFDEEHSQEVYSEGITRTAAGKGIIINTFTPLEGISPVVKNFLDNNMTAETGELSPTRFLLRATWDDAPHLTLAKREVLLKGYLPHEVEARTKGIPGIGTGAIFPFERSTYIIEPFELPKYWPRAYGFDVGRNTAAIWMAKDRDTGIRYIYNEMFKVEGAPSEHASAIIARGKWQRGAIDTAARGRSATDGENLFQMYKDLGLNIQNAEKAVEAGIAHIYEGFMNGTIKIFSNCIGLLEEIAIYHRDKKGNVFKFEDHRMDAFRYVIMTADAVLWNENEAIAASQPVLYDFDHIKESNAEDSWMVT